MKKFLLSIASLSLVFGLFISFSLAQTTTQKTNTNVQSLLLATVNIYNATNTKINNNTYHITFQLNNRVGIQSDIRYGVELVKKDNGEIADLNLVNTALTLKEGEGKNISLTYTIPSFIPNGTYKLMIVSQNSSGLPLAIVPAGYPETIVEVDNNTNSINLENCSLSIATTTFKANQLVRLNAGQVLTANCSINNQSSNTNLSLQLITHNQDKFGNIINSQVLDQDLNIKRKAISPISFNIPTETNPGTYSVEAFLINRSKDKVSASTYLNYNINGTTATIQNIILDKANYQKGDTAKLQAFFYTSTQNPKDNLSIKAEIYDNSNNLCGEISKDITGKLTLDNFNLNIPITKDCSGAIAKVSISNNGNTLTSSEINSNQPEQQININSNVKTIPNLDLNLNKVYILIFILILVLLAYGIIIFRKNINLKK